MVYLDAPHKKKIFFDFFWLWTGLQYTGRSCGLPAFPACCSLKKETPVENVMSVVWFIAPSLLLLVLKFLLLFPSKTGCTACTCCGRFQALSYWQIHHSKGKSCAFPHLSSKNWLRPACEPGDRFKVWWWKKPPHKRKLVTEDFLILK